MKKFEYKQMLLDNEEQWKDAGLQKGWAKNTDKPCSLKFADKLGREGWEMYSVVQYGTNTGYFFKREI